MADEKKLNKGQDFNFTAPVAGEGGATAASADMTNNANATGQEQPLAFEQKNLIKVGKVDYAVGLFWQPLQDVDDPIPEIRETMEADVGTNLYTIHYGRAPQYGIGRTDKGHKEGQPAGAIAVLDSLSDKSSFVAVFKVDEGWWFLVARNDLILPEEDILYRTEQEAKDAFYSMMAVPDWGYKIAPSSWNIDDTEEMQAEDLLKNGLQVRLYSLSAIRGTKVLLMIALLILAIVGLAVYSVLFFIDREKAEPTIIEPVIPQASIQTVEPQREEEKPWEKMVSVPEFLNRCWSDSYQLKTMQIPGWRLNQITCTPSGITTGWTNSGNSRVAWLETAVRDQYRIKGEVQINETGTAATIKITFDGLPVVASSPTLSVQKLRRELTDISQALSMPITMNVGQIVVEAPKPPQGAAGQQAQQQPAKIYKYLSFAFSSSMDPPAWESFFKPFAALEVTKIEYNPGSDSALTSNWKYEGRIYEVNK